MEDQPFIDTLRGMRIGGRYVVDKILGAGGMGVVALARYPDLQQKVAIKFLFPQHAANAVLNQRFVREGRIAAQVKSEHFVRVFDIGKLPNGIPYLVMELLAGKDLSDVIATEGQLPVDRAVDYLLQAMVGVAEVHALGVVHRDLKPSNLFVAEVGGKRVIKVLDFGVSKESPTRSEASLTATDNLLGTPQYMSPEQVRASKEVDARSDIWALGVILYELLTSKRPFTSDENAVGELFAKVMYIDAPPLADYRSDLPEGLEAVIRKCMTRELSGRYANVGELADALRPFAAPASEHRFEAVHQALAVRHSMMPPPMLPPVANDVETRVLGKSGARDSASEIEFAPTAVSEATGIDSARRSAAPITALTSSQASISRDASRWRAPLVVVAAIALAGGTFALFTRGSGSPAPATEGASTPTSGSSPLTSSSAASASESAAVAASIPEAPPTAPLETAAPSTAASTKPAIRPPIKPVPRPPMPPTPASPTPAKPPSTADLIQDRK